MANLKLVKVTITGYYTMDTADEVYGAASSEEIVAVDQQSIDVGASDAYVVIDWLDGVPVITGPGKVILL